MNVEKPSNELAAYIKNLQAENVVIKTSDIKELLTNNGLFNLTESEINEIIKQSDIGGQENDKGAKAGDNKIEGSELRTFCTALLNKILGKSDINGYDSYYREMHPFDPNPQDIDKKVMMVIDYIVDIPKKLMQLNKDSTEKPNTLAVNKIVPDKIPYKK